MVAKVRPRRAPRPNVTLLCRRLVADMAAKLPEMSHVKAARILFVAGEARRASRATVRPLAATGRPLVKLRGKRALYTVTLRPKFFRGSTPEERVETLLHELFHISPGFDGTLDAARRHSQLPRRRFDAQLRPLVRRYLKAMPEELYQSLSVNGVVSARQWLEKPGITSSSKRNTAHSRRIYTEKELFLGPLRMITQGQKRPVPEGRIH